MILLFEKTKILTIKIDMENANSNARYLEVNKVKRTNVSILTIHLANKMLAIESNLSK